jgi:F0F1-type ATP synthase assembly protein I
VKRPPSSSSPVAEALHWVSRITTVGLMMVLPTIGGRWLDQHYGTSYWGLLGLVVGLAIGMWQITLIAVAAKPRAPSNSAKSTDAKTIDQTEPKPPSESA